MPTGPDHLSRAVDDPRRLTPPPDARRLHPLSPLLGLAPVIRQLAVPIAILVVASWRVAAPFVVGGVLVLFVPVALRARFTRYTLDDQQLLVWSGVFQRQVRVVAPARVQQVDVIRQLRHRATDLAAVRIELVGTGGSASRVELDALTLAEAERLHDALERGRRQALGEMDDAGGTTATVGAHDVPAPPPAPLLRLSTRQLVVAGLTGAPMLLAPLAVVSLVLQLDDMLRWGQTDVFDPRRVSRTLLFVLLVVAWPVIAGGVMVIRCHGFELGRSGRDLIARRGLLDTRTSVLPLPRVQLVDRTATAPRRWLRLASLEVRTASGGTTTQYPVGVTVPIAPAATADDLIGLVVGRPGLALDVNPHPPAARRRAVMRRAVGLGAPALAISVVSMLTNDAAPGRIAAAAATVAVAVVAAAFGWGRSWYRRLGHARRDGLLLVRTGVLIEHLRLVPLDRIQSITISQNPWQRRAGLCTARVLLAGLTTESVRVPDLAPAAAVELAGVVRGLHGIDTLRWDAALSSARV